MIYRYKRVGNHASRVQKLSVNSCVQTKLNKMHIDFHDNVKMNDGSDVKKRVA